MSFSVGHRRSSKSSVTGFCNMKDCPKSPFRQLMIQSVYWVKNGLSRPRLWRISSIISVVGMMPLWVKMFRAGSPGDKYVNKKVRKLIPISTIAICSNLDMICFVFIFISPRHWNFSSIN